MFVVEVARRNEPPPPPAISVPVTAESFGAPPFPPLVQVGAKPLLPAPPPPAAAYCESEQVGLSRLGELPPAKP